MTRPTPEKRATVDALKLERDGHLGYGPKHEPPPRMRREWAVEFDDDGRPVRMIWMGDNR